MKPLTLRSLLAVVPLVAVGALLVVLLPPAGKRLVDVLGRQLGVELQVEGISGTLFTRLRCERIGIARKGRQPDEAPFALELHDLSVTYFLPHLLQGRDAFLSSMEIDIARLQAAVRPAPTAENGDAAATGGAVPVLPPRLPALTVAALELQITAPGYRAIATGKDLAVASPLEEKGQEVVLDLPLIRLELPDQQTWHSAASVRLHYSGHRFDLEQVALTAPSFAVAGTISWGAPHVPLTWDLQGKSGRGRFVTTGAYDGQHADGRLQVENVDIAGLGALPPALALAPGGRLSGVVTGRFDVKNSRLVNGEADLALEAGRLAGHAATVQLQGAISSGIVSIERLAGHFGMNEAEVTGGRLPLECFRSFPFTLPPSATIETVRLSLRDIPALFAISGMASPVPITFTHALTLTGRLVDGTVRISRAEFSAPGSSLLLNEATLALPGANGDSLLDAPLQANGSFRLTDLTELALFPGLPAMVGAGEGEAVITGSLRRPRGTVRLQTRELQVDGCPLGDVALAAHADGKIIDIRSLTLRNEGDMVEAQGRYQIDRATFDELNGKLTVDNISRYIASCFGVEQELSGRLRAALASDGSDRIGIDLVLEQGSFAGIAVPVLAGKVTTDGRRSHIEQGEIHVPRGAVRFAAEIESDWPRETVRADFSRLSASWNGVDFSLSHPAAVTLDFGKEPTLAMDEMFFQSRVGEIRMQGDVARHGQSNLQVRGTGLSSEGWLDDLTGPEWRISGVDILFSLHGPLETPRTTLAADIETISWSRLPVPLAGKLGLDYDSRVGIVLHRLDLNDINGQQRISMAGRIPYDPLAQEPFLALPLALTADVVINGLPGLAADNPDRVAGNLAGTLKLSGSWARPSGELRLQGGNLPLHHFFPGVPAEPLTVAGLLRYQGEEMRLDELRVHSPLFSVEAGGRWLDIPTLQALLDQRAAELPGRFDLHASLTLPDAGRLAAYLPDVRRLAGQLGAELRLDGPAARPEVTGRIALEQGEIRLENPLFPPLNKVVMSASLAGGILSLDQLSGRFGGAPVEVAGKIAVTGEEAPRFDCRLTGRSLLFYRDEAMKMRGDADLRLSGPLARLALDGTVTLTDGLYGKNVDFLAMLRGTGRAKTATNTGGLFSWADAPLRDLRFDVKIVTGKKPFFIANNLTKGAVRPTLRLTGSGEAPLLAGRIYVEPTTISVPAGRLRVDAGVISLPENEPDRIFLDLHGGSRLAGHDITMTVEGSADEPVITLSSDPPLPDDELLLLVLTGSPPQADRESGRSALANMKMAVYLGRGLLAGWFGGVDEDEESVLERFDLEFGRQISDSGQETVEASFRLVEGLLLPGDRLFLVSEKDRYDNVNVGIKVVFRFL